MMIEKDLKSYECRKSRDPSSYHYIIDHGSSITFYSILRIYAKTFIIVEAPRSLVLLETQRLSLVRKCGMQHNKQITSSKNMYEQDTRSCKLAFFVQQKSLRKLPCKYMMFSHLNMYDATSSNLFSSVRVVWRFCNNLSVLNCQKNNIY